MDFKVTFAAQAERDLFDTALSLAQMPNRGVVVRARTGIRKLAHRPYHLIFYRVDETRRLVEIARFWDGRQDPSLLKMD